jgi:hypothetical protein
VREPREARIRLEHDADGIAPGDVEAHAVGHEPLEAHERIERVPQRGARAHDVTQHAEHRGRSVPQRRQADARSGSALDDRLAEGDLPRERHVGVAIGQLLLREPGRREQLTPLDAQRGPGREHGLHRPHQHARPPHRRCTARLAGTRGHGRA